MKFASAIDAYVTDQFAQGRFRSPRTEVSYRAALDRMCDVVNNRDPRYIGRDDVKRTLSHWSHPNSRRTNHAILRAFFDWLMEEGLRKDNPARQVQRSRGRKPEVYRLTREEAGAMLDSAKGPRERRAIFLGICAGLRNAELRGMTGRHFQRPGLIWVSGEIAKGGRERWVPIVSELELVVAEIREHVAQDEYVLPAQRFRDVGVNRSRVDKAGYPSSSQALRSLVQRVGKRAGIAEELHPHLLRHAFGDHIARYAGMRNAQYLLGHAEIGTTETYVGQPTLDELAASIRGFGFGSSSTTGGTHVLGVASTPHSPLKATTGIEPVQPASRVLERLRKPHMASGTLAIGRPACC